LDDLTQYLRQNVRIGFTRPVKVEQASRYDVLFGVSSRGQRHQLLALQLGKSIDVERPGRIILTVR